MERAIPILPADDLAVAKTFYVDGLGFRVTFDASADGRTGLLGLERGTIRLTLDCPMEGHGRNACVSIEVDDADAYYREWSGKVAVKRPPRDEDWGARTFDLRDPFGNTIFIMEPISKPDGVGTTPNEGPPAAVATRGEPVQVTTYLSFRGECEAAFTFYEQCLNGKLGEIFRYAGSPMADQAPPDWQHKVMHGSLTIGEHMLMGGDVAPERYEKPQGFSLSIQLKSTAQAERIFHLLAKDGTIVMPLEKTFWAARFGVLVDRFGIPWLINCEASEQVVEA